MLEKNIDNYNKNGFSVMRNFIPKQKLFKLNIKIKKFLKKKEKNLKGKNINYSSGNRVNSAHDIDKFDPFFKKFSNQKFIIQMVEKFLQSKTVFRKSEIFAKPAKVGLQSPMHQDNFYWGIKNNNALTIWVALDHCNKSNGGLTYFKGSHKYGIVKHVDSYEPGSSQKISSNFFKKKRNFKKITPTLNPGDVLIHHCLTIHGSKPNRSSKSRRGFTMQFKDKFSKYDKKLVNYYRSKLNKQVKLRQKY